MRASNEAKVQIRTSQEEKAFLVKAAQRCGFKTLSEFMRVSSHEKAKRDLKDFPEVDTAHYGTATLSKKLSPKDSIIFAESILSPPEPNEKLKNLLSNHYIEQINQNFTQK